jgi:hypothetical protein
MKEIIMMNKKIDLNLVNDIAASYKKLMAVCEEAKHAGYVMDAIDELRDNLSVLSMETEQILDIEIRESREGPREIRRAGGWEAWDALTPAQQEVV